MQKKQIVRLGVDAAMTVVLLLLMGYSRIGETAHEWLGIGMLGLFVLHHVLNRKWIARLFHGRYTPFRIAQTILACAAFLSLCGSGVSGVMVSRHVFLFLDVSEGTSFARQLHMLCGYWNLVLLSLHLGLHWIMVTVWASRTVPAEKPWLRWTARAAALAIAAYGVYALIVRQVAGYLLGTVAFAFFDEAESLFAFLLDYLSIMGTFVCLGHYAAKIFRKRRHE